MGYECTNNGGVQMKMEEEREGGSEDGSSKTMEECEWKVLEIRGCEQNY